MREVHGEHAPAHVCIALWFTVGVPGGDGQQEAGAQRWTLEGWPATGMACVSRGCPALSAWHALLGLQRRENEQPAEGKGKGKHNGGGQWSNKRHSTWSDGNGSGSHWHKRARW